MLIDDGSRTYGAARRGSTPIGEPATRTRAACEAHIEAGETPASRVRGPRFRATSPQSLCAKGAFVFALRRLLYAIGALREGRVRRAAPRRAAAAVVELDGVTPAIPLKFILREWW